MKFLFTLFSALFFLILTLIAQPLYAQVADPSYAALTDQPPTSAVDVETSIKIDTVVPDLFTGSMHYSIPIKVPAGRKGMQPNLALTYRNSQQNGWLGLGWELQAGSIERNTKNGVDYDGDSYILKINGASTELINNNGTYEQKIENEFFKITPFKDASGRPTDWEVVDKKGVVYSFGKTFGAASGPRLYDPSDSTKVFKWYLNRITDPSGNQIEFFYFNDIDQDGKILDIYLDFIKYTGGPTEPANTVKFVKESGCRLDARASYKANFLVKTRYRLESIEVKAGESLIRKYKMDYGDPTSVTAQSLLRSIQQYGSDGTSTLPPVTFTYSPDASFSIVSSPFGLLNGPAISNEVYNYAFGDFNADGRTDGLMVNTHDCPGCSQVNLLPLEVWPSNGDGFVEGNNWLTLDQNFADETLKIAADFNGDGTSDMLFLPIIPDAIYADINLSLNVNASSFTSYSKWLTISPYDYNRVRLGDVDGNGKADLIYIDESGNIQVYLSTGAEFILQPVQFNLGNTVHSADPAVYSDENRYKFGDFNGDKNMDLVYIDTSGNLWVALSTGTTFSMPQQWLSVAAVNSSIFESPGSYPDQYAVADFDGDGKADIFYVNSAYPAGTYYIALSAGHSFANPTIFSQIGKSGDVTRYYFADFDGNGTQDILYAGIAHDDSVENEGFVNPVTLEVVLSTGVTSTTAVAPSVNTIGTVYSVHGANKLIGQFHVGDFNGDGRAEIAFVDWSIYDGSALDLQIARVTGPSDNPKEGSNLLTIISNGIGGSTTITYAPSTEYANTYLPFAVQTVSSVKTSDGNGNTAETKYSYEGGYYHKTELDFRGFNHVTVAGPLGPDFEQQITETWFYQGIASSDDSCTSSCNSGTVCKPCPPAAPNGRTSYLKGRPYHRRVSAASGAVYSETATTYAVNNRAGGGYFYLPDQVSTYICDGNTSAICDSATSGLSKTIKYSYDEYGNTTQEQVFTPANSSTPYQTTTRTFTTDSTDNYIVGLPKSEIVTDNATGETASSTTYYYDGATNCDTLSQNQTPTEGNLTAITRKIDETTVETATTQMAYEFGNRVCTKDPNGITSTLDYDAGTKTYIVKKTKAKNTARQQETIIKYYGIDATGNGLYGQVMSITDANNETAFEYDVFGRKTKVTDSFGGTITYSYPGNSILGQVGTQQISTTTLADYATGAVITKKSYFGGFGRTFKTESTGPDNKTIVTKADYDNRGSVSRSYLPYFNGAGNNPATSFEYDAIGRVKQKTTPDGKVIKSCYLQGVTATIDPDGNKKRETKDIFGRLVRVDEYDPDTKFTTCSTELGAAYASTTYQYDVLGNLRYVNDAEGNQTEMRYDMLGRKTYMKDPDMGVWGYTYDKNGNLETQTDANHPDQHITFHYDELNRVYWKEYPKNGPITMTDVNYTYDVAPDTAAPSSPVGRLSTMSDASGTTKYYYDKLGRTTQTTKVVDNDPAKTYTFVTAYNALGKPTAITYPDGETAAYAYDVGLLSAITGSNINFAVYSGYNAIGQPGTITYPNTVATNYTYDQNTYRIKQIVTGNSNQNVINLEYAYYDGGNIRDITDNVEWELSQSFWYDGLGRLYQAQTAANGAYGYDNTAAVFYDYSMNGNLTNKENTTLYYTDNTGLHPHAVKSTSSGMSYTYDTNGNMISENLNGSVYRTITYDYDNMPQTVTVNGIATAFVHDGAGNRAKKINSTGENIYLGKLYECREGICTKYIFNGDTRVALKSGEDVYFYHQDHLGSSQVVTQIGAIQGEYCASTPIRIEVTASHPAYDFLTLQAAYDAAIDNDTIKARELNFKEDLTFNNNTIVTIKGGYDCTFTQQVENSELEGMISANTGTVTIGNLEIVTSSYPKYTVEVVRYRPYGEALRDTGIVSVTHKFTSQEFDAETGLYNFGARYYNPVLGRFISSDSMVPDFRNPQALNRYSYGINNPLKYVDPTGNYYAETGGCYDFFGSSYWSTGNDFFDATFMSFLNDVNNLGGLFGNTALNAAGYVKDDILIGRLKMSPYDVEAFSMALTLPFTFAQFSRLSSVAEISTGFEAYVSEEAFASRVAAGSADATRGARLQSELVFKEAKSAFTTEGKLSQEAIAGAREIVPGSELGNPAIPEGFSKYATETYRSPSGPFQVHFYMGSKTGEVFYDLDFKANINSVLNWGKIK